MHLSCSFLFGLGGEHGEGEVVVGAGRVVVVGPPGIVKHDDGIFKWILV